MSWMRATIKHGFASMVYAVKQAVGSCWPNCAAGALMACAGELMGCCFLHMLGQFSFPAPYIPFVAPAIEFT